MPENAYRRRHLHDHLVRSDRIADIRGQFPDAAEIEYGDGTGYCKRCGMNEPRHTARCPEAKKERA